MAALKTAGANIFAGVVVTININNFVTRPLAALMGDPNTNGAAAPALASTYVIMIQVSLEPHLDLSKYNKCFIKLTVLESLVACLRRACGLLVARLRAPVSVLVLCLYSACSLLVACL